MGKTQRQSPTLNAIMTDENSSPQLENGLSRNPTNEEDIETFNVLTHFEDVEQIKERMRKVVVELNDVSTTTTMGTKSTTGSDSVVHRQEMSSSLPNLSILTEKGSEILSKLSQKIISTSATDVRKSVSLTSKPSCDENNQENNAATVISNPTENSLCSSTECTDSDSVTVKDNSSIKITPDINEMVTNETINDSCIEESQTAVASKEQEPQSNMSKPMHNGNGNQKNSIVLSLDSENSNLSSVLENMSLLYIPKTKQLVSQSHGCDLMPNSCLLQAADTSSQISDEQSTDSTVISPPSLINTSLDSYSNVLDMSVSSSTALLDDDENDEGRDCLSNLDLSDKTTDSPRSTLPRSTTAGSLGQTDTSSYSSISSLSLGNASISDEGNLEVKNIPSDFDEMAFMEVNLDGRNSFEKCRNLSQDSGIADGHDQCGAKPKPRVGLTRFFARGLFSRKPKEQDSPPGWKLFGKVPPKQAPTKDPSEITTEYQANQRAHSRKKDVEVTSTTALILENRPSGLPCKTPEEELKHKQQYEAMVEAAKKKELKEAKMKKKQMQQQLKQEQLMTQSLRVWNTEILPNWESMGSSKKARDLWWMGLPPSVRGKVWRLAIGNELNITPELYEICVSRAEDRIRIMSEGDSDSICSNEPASSKEASVDLIKLDVSRTFPQLCIFQKGGPYHDLLHSLLGAYACYRPDVGYVQGMSFIAAVLLLNMDVADAFICFANLLNKPCQVTFFRMDESIMKAYFATYEEFFAENLPRLFNHFNKNKLTPDLYIIDWMFTLFSKSLPLDVASRVWDVYYRDGEEFLFRTALGILKLHEDLLLHLDFIHLAQFLTRLPENISSHDLFMNIKHIDMTIDNRKYCQVLAANRDNLKDS